MSLLEREHYLISLELMRNKVGDPKKYPYNIEIIKNLTKLIFHPNVTFITGENGSGKSTIVEAIATAYGFNPEGGSKNFKFSTFSSHSSLYSAIKLTKNYVQPRDGYFLRAESYFNVSSEIEKLDEDPTAGPPIISFYGNKSLHKQSHGEAFFSLIMHRFGRNGLYILDEPEAALSPTRQMAMLTRIHELVEQKSQLIIATHSPILLSYPNADIYEISTGQMIKTQYEETTTYTSTRDFLNAPKAFLNALLS